MTDFSDMIPGNVTPEELRELADKLEEEESYKKIKVGVLKEDLLDGNASLGGYIDDRGFCTKDELDELLAEIKNSFKVVVPAGSKFYCYSYGTHQTWEDGVNYGIEFTEEEAEKYLIDIRKVGKDS